MLLVDFWRFSKNFHNSWPDQLCAGSPLKSQFRWMVMFCVHLCWSSNTCVGLNVYGCNPRWSLYFKKQTHKHTHTQRSWVVLQPAVRWPSLQSADVPFPLKRSTLSQQSSAENLQTLLLLLWNKQKNGPESKLCSFYIFCVCAKLWFVIW